MIPSASGIRAAVEREAEEDRRLAWDLFAVAALSGICSREHMAASEAPGLAARLADRMLDEREKRRAGR